MTYKKQTGHKYGTSNALLKEVQKRLGVTEDDAKFLLAELAESIISTTLKENVCFIRLLGTFRLKSKKNAKFRNPQTGKEIIVPLLYRAYFQPANFFKNCMRAKGKGHFRTIYDFKEDKGNKL